MFPSESGHPGAETERILYADIIRIVAIMAVVFLHISAYSMSRSSVGSSRWWIGHIFDSLARPGAPLFIMLSGMLLLDPARDYPLRTFLKRRLLRISIPFAVWSIVYILARILFRAEKLTPLDVLKLFIGGESSNHLWFIRMILGLYIITPVIKIYVNNATEKNIRYFLVIWLIFQSLVPLIIKFSPIDNIAIRADFATAPLGYYILGYYISRKPSAKEDRRYFAALFIAGYLITVFGSYLTSITLPVTESGKPDLYFYDYKSPNVIFMSVSMFLILRGIDYQRHLKKRRFVRKFIGNLCSSSFGIYLVHVLFIGLIDSGFFGLFYLTGSTNILIEIFAGFIIVTTLSLVCVNLLKRIPIVKYSVL